APSESRPSGPPAAIAPRRTGDAGTASAAVAAPAPPAIPGLIGGKRSNLQLRAELDDPVRGDAEVRRRRGGVARPGRAELLPPERHAGAAGRDQGLAAEEERRLVDLHRETAAAAELEDVRHVRRLEEAEARDHTEEALAELLERDALGAPHLRLEHGQDR